MKRCRHDWLPLVTATPPQEGQARMVFALSLGKLGNYDRCTLCKRLSYLHKRRRFMVSSDTTEIERRATEFDQWAATL